MKLCSSTKTLQNISRILARLQNKFIYMYLGCLPLERGMRAYPLQKGFCGDTYSFPANWKLKFLCKVRTTWKK